MEFRFAPGSINTHITVYLHGAKFQATVAILFLNKNGAGDKLNGKTIIA